MPKIYTLSGRTTFEYSLDGKGGFFIEYSGRPHITKQMIRKIETEFRGKTVPGGFSMTAPIPGGFGERGMGGKLGAVGYAIENEVPLFGICLGMQCMVIEFARRHGMENAHSTEFDPKTPYPVIDLMEEQKKIKNMGGTMRLGSYP